VYRPPEGPRLWLAPALGGAGVALGVILLLVGLDRDVGTLPLAALFALTAIVVTLSVLLVAEQRGWRSTASRVDDLEERLASQAQALSEAGTRDSLTGLRNRLAFYETIETDFARAMRSGEPLACVLIDLDYFRRVNDRFGHHFGDTVLVRFTGMLSQLLRGADLVCRYGGDEFILMLAESTAAQAMIVAERIRQQLKREVFSDGTVAAAITASFGVAAVPLPGITRPNELIERVESALEEAKRGGRDRIAVDPAIFLATPPITEPSGETLA
jgi:diguanylate cyclase (GGDEF)-like protein